VSVLVRAHLTANQIAREYLREVAACKDAEDEQPDPEVLAAAEQVVRESRAVVAAATAYAKEQLLPRDGGQLAAQLQSRLAALRVLEEQKAFLDRIEAAGGCRWALWGWGLALVAAGKGAQSFDRSNPRTQTPTPSPHKHLHIQA